MKKKKKIILLVLLAVAITAAAIWIAWENTALELNTFRVTSPLLPEKWDGFRIAQVSDLHNAEMGPGNEKLLQLLREAKPDLIAITGDMIDSRRTDMDIALDFAGEAMKIAPCCYVTGNHEARFDKAVLASFEDRLRALGVTVLRNDQLVLEKEGQSLIIVGMDDPDFIDKKTAHMAPQVLELLESGRFEILLTHRPEMFEDYVAAGADVVLAGHVHGGQIRIPYLGGVFAPHQGFFAQYDAGLYADGQTQMVVSRGIGNSLFPFRVNNPPEVVLIELKCK